MILRTGSTAGWCWARPSYCPAPWHFLYFFPLPHGHGSLRPTSAYGSLLSLTTVAIAPPPPATAAACAIASGEGPDTPAALAASIAPAKIDASLGAEYIMGCAAACICSSGTS